MDKTSILRYDTSVMKRRTRRLFFYALVVLFAIAGPLLIAYSFGYTYDFSRAEFRQNGGIFVKSKIPSARVFLDGVFIKQTGLIIGSTLLTDVSPRRHLVRLEKQGYRAWSKIADVKSALVTELRSVLLVPNPLHAASSTPDDRALMTPTPRPISDIRQDRAGNLTSTANNERQTIAANVHSFTALPDGVLYADKNGFFARYDTAHQKTDIIGRPGFYLTASPLQFFPSLSYNFVAVLDPSGGLFLFNNATREIKAIEGGVRAASFDGEENKLLIQKDHSIDVLWLGENRFQPFQKAGTRDGILSVEETIKEAAWFYGDNAHVAFRTQDGIFLTEIDGRGGRNTVQLAPSGAANLATSPALPNAIFFKTGKTSFKIEL